MFSIGLTDHVEGPADRPSSAIFDEVIDIVRLADRLGVAYAWFAEHHAHAHKGHLPSPLLLALHLAGQTESIRLGTAILCLNLHNPLDVAEQVATADALAGGRLAVGFGSGSTPGEAGLFGLAEVDEATRHARFAEALAAIRRAWLGEGEGEEAAPSPILPRPDAGLPGRCWLAVNSVGSARVAGSLGFNVLFSHLRTPGQYADYRGAYDAAGGSGLVAINRPVFVGADDASAFAEAGPALRLLWRRFRAEGKIPAGAEEPTSLEGLSAHPINFVVGGPATVARRLAELHEAVAFDVANLEVRWAGLSHGVVRESLRRLMEDAVPRLATPARPFSGTARRT